MIYSKTFENLARNTVIGLNIQKSQVKIIYLLPLSEAEFAYENLII